MPGIQYILNKHLPQKCASGGVGRDSGWMRTVCGVLFLAFQKHEYWSWACSSHVLSIRTVGITTVSNSCERRTSFRPWQYLKCQNLGMKTEQKRCGVAGRSPGMTEQAFFTSEIKARNKCQLRDNKDIWYFSLIYVGGMIFLPLQLLFLSLPSSSSQP